MSLLFVSPTPIKDCISTYHWTIYDQVIKGKHICHSCISTIEYLYTTRDIYKHYNTGGLSYFCLKKGYGSRYVIQHNTPLNITINYPRQKSILIPNLDKSKVIFSINNLSFFIRNYFQATTALAGLPKEKILNELITERCAKNIVLMEYKTFTNYFSYYVIPKQCDLPDYYFMYNNLPFLTTVNN